MRLFKKHETREHERDLAGPGVYLPASELEVCYDLLTGLQIDSWPCQSDFTVVVVIQEEVFREFCQNLNLQ